jgi:hypothetical protein
MIRIFKFCLEILNSDASSCSGESWVKILPWLSASNWLLMKPCNLKNFITRYPNNSIISAVINGENVPLQEAVSDMDTISSKLLWFELRNRQINSSLNFKFVSLKKFSLNCIKLWSGVSIDIDSTLKKCYINCCMEDSPKVQQTSNKMINISLEKCKYLESL